MSTAIQSPADLADLWDQMAEECTAAAENTRSLDVNARERARAAQLRQCAMQLQIVLRRAPGDAGQPVRTVERGYAASTGRRAGQVRRVHVIRQTPTRSLPAGSSAWCGIQTGNVTDSPGVVRETPHALPAGLSWCPKCIGHLAEQSGRLDEVAKLLGAGAAR